MTAADAAWAAGLMERRRQVYAAYSPVFWRPRLGVTGLHARFLGRQTAPPVPASARAAAIARRPGWTVASDWYLGRPA